MLDAALSFANMFLIFSSCSGSNSFFLGLSSDFVLLAFFAFALSVSGISYDRASLFSNASCLLAAFSLVLIGWVFVYIIFVRSAVMPSDELDAGVDF